MKKLAIVMNEDHRITYSGVSRFVMEVAPRLAAQFKVTILSSRSNSGIRRFHDGPHLETVQFPLLRLPFRNIFIPRFTGEAREIVEDSDLLFLQTLDSIRPFQWAVKSGVPVVVYLHAIDWERPIGPTDWMRIPPSLVRAYCRHWYRLADRICLPSLSLHHWLKKAAISTPVYPVPVGINTDCFAPAVDKSVLRKKLGLEKEAVILGFVGRVWPEKNLKFLFRIFRLLSVRHPELRLLLVGGGLPSYERFFHNQPGVIRVGLQKEIAPYLAAMDIFVHPMIPFETSSLATMEAMATGLPVVVNAVGCARDYIRHGENGFLVDPANDESQFLSHLTHLIQSGEERKRIGSKARRTMIAHGGWDATSDKLTSLFNQVGRSWNS